MLLKLVWDFQVGVGVGVGGTKCPSRLSKKWDTVLIQKASGLGSYRSKVCMEGDCCTWDVGGTGTKSKRIDCSLQTSKISLRLDGWLGEGPIFSVMTRDPIGSWKALGQKLQTVKLGGLLSWCSKPTPKKTAGLTRNLCLPWALVCIVNLAQST